ncbi:MAG TPA: septal ring lytic transglycosylase RlpA family protein [Thermoleophilaceae bacterium]
MTHRCKSALIAACAAGLLVVPADAPAETGSGSGGSAAPGSGGATDSGFVLSSRRSVSLGQALRIAGKDARAAGHQVRIDAQGADGQSLPAVTVAAAGDGSFSALWKPAKAGRYLLRAVLGDGQAEAGAAQAASAPLAVTVFRTVKATWYGPGFYGKKTACGQRLTRALVGIAHRTLPCGSTVAVTYRGRTLNLPVIDRGPFARGVSYDLTGAAAKALGMTVTSRIGVAPIPLQQPNKGP